MNTSTDNNLLPAYLIVGEDALKRERTLARLRMRLEKLGDISFNFDAFDGCDCEGEAVASACMTMPFASEKRLVQVNNADKLKKADSEVLVKYLEAPNESTVLCLIAEKLAKNTRLYKAINSVGKTAIIDCAKKSSREMPALVRGMGPAHGVVLSQGAADKLLELVGEDTVKLDSEIQKIAAAHKGPDPVSAREVAELVCSTNTSKPWELVDAFINRNIGKCIQLLGTTDASPLAILPMCTAKIREVICIKCMQARGASNPVSAAAKELKLPDWRLKSAANAARIFSMAELEGALCSSLTTERKMKSGADAGSTLLIWMLDVMKK
jgi:DNA polymerase-3 subunit delta